MEEVTYRVPDTRPQVLVPAAEESGCKCDGCTCECPCDGDECMCETGDCDCDCDCTYGSTNAADDLEVSDGAACTFGRASMAPPGVRPQGPIPEAQRPTNIIVMHFEPGSSQEDMEAVCDEIRNFDDVLEVDLHAGDHRVRYDYAVVTTNDTADVEDIARTINGLRNVHNAEAPHVLYGEDDESEE